LVVVDLFSVIVTLPIQFATPQHGQRAQGERAMVAAFLEGAKKELSSPSPRIRSEAELWFLDGDLGMFTARECCEYMGIGYEMVRKGVMQEIMRRAMNETEKKEATFQPPPS
jgi:hypothetical protein